MINTNSLSASRRSPLRSIQHAQQGGFRASRQHAWLQSSVARRLMAETQFLRRPSTEPTSNERNWLEGSNCDGPGVTAQGRYLPSSKAKQEAASAALLRRRTVGGQKFYSNYNSQGYDESCFPCGSQQVPITAWNTPSASGFGAATCNRGYTLPENVTLVTLEEVDGGDVLVRLAHLYQEGEHRELSKPAYIDIRHLFDGCQIISACEMDLSATQFKGNLRDHVIELRPMQVRTFLLTIN